MATESTSSLKKNFFFAIVAAYSAYYFYRNYEGEDAKLKNVLSGLLDVEKTANLSINLPIATGFGSCIDLKLDAIPLMNAIGIQPPKEAKYHESMKSLQDISEMLAFYMEQGAAVERFISVELLQQLVEAAEKLKDVPVEWSAGGNAPVMSKRFSMEGFENVYVGSVVSAKLKTFFPDKMTFLPGVPIRDDLHLVLEYKVGEKWGKYVVSRANRFIVHSDHNNPYIKSLEGFHNVIKEVQPRIVIVSGLQMLDNFPFKEGVRESRMDALEVMLQSIPESTLIHFEMASFSEVAMMASVLKHVMPYADSVGMNEQELPNLVSMIKTGDVIEVADSNPRTASVLDDMRMLYKHYLQHSKRGLTRLHLHTLAFQAVLTKKGSQWKHNKAASARASLTAIRYICGSNEVDVTKARIIMDESFSLSVNGSDRIYFDESNPISCWDEEDYEICIAPMLVCTDVKQTAGGGDNISAAGLMIQI